MKDLCSPYLNDELWLVKEIEWARPLQNIREAQLALGNGYLGTRAVYEEIPYDAQGGTYIAGVYDKIGSQVAELVNLPNPVNFKFVVEGEKLDLVAMDCLEHKRVLNMRKAVLLRRTIYQDTKKRRYRYESSRFISLSNKNIGVMQIALTCLDASSVVEINTGIDTSISNTGVLTEGRKRHFRIKELGQSHNAGFLVIETLEKKYNIVYWSGFYYEVGESKIFARENIFHLKFKKDQTVIFTKVFCIKHFPYQSDPTPQKEEAFKIFYKAFHTDFSLLVKAHTDQWEGLWQKTDILIEGTANLQINLRFNIYHMLTLLNYDEGFSSIGARALSGEGYHGHIFWDTEIFLMPFYLFNFPEIAKNILLYRYRRLDKAKELAKKEGFRGVKFPWESADTGEEETPEWARDFDGTIIKIYTHQMEHHITSDIAYAVYRYYVATGDEEFMRDCGYEIFFETAKFWVSKVEFNKRKNSYEIRNIIGPDEFHLNVNNNAFTNMMAKWNLLTSYKMYKKIKRDYPGLYRRLKERLNLSERETREWKKISSGIKFNIGKNKVIEQFDGFFKLKRIHLSQCDENGIFILPPKFKAKDLGKTQLIKQADVLMLLWLLDDVFSLKTKLVNYEFYIKRTIHKSSLSPAIHSLIASKVGDLNRAYNLFNVSLRTDIGNLYGNTREGIHGASLGGTWQAVIFGFGGIEIKKEKLFINPRMPRTWRKMVFSLSWKKDLVKLEMTNNLIKLKVESPKQKVVDIGVFGKLVSLKTNREYTFTRHIPLYKEYYHY